MLHNSPVRDVEFVLTACLEHIRVQFEPACCRCLEPRFGSDLAFERTDVRRSGRSAEQLGARLADGAPTGLTSPALALTVEARGVANRSAFNQRYRIRGHLEVQILDSGAVWLDTGRFRRAGWIDSVQLAQLATGLQKSGYGRYLSSLLAEAPGAA